MPNDYFAEATSFVGGVHNWTSLLESRQVPACADPSGCDDIDVEQQAVMIERSDANAARLKGRP
jgi:hypothetical protein